MMAMMAWRLLRTGPGEPAWNMALDEALWRSFPKAGRPTLRLYRWARPTLSIGYSQRVGEFDLEACAELGVEIVRRPTGGGAVLHRPHDYEVTYSLVHQVEGLGNVKESHRMIAEALASGLRRLGLAVEVQDRAHAQNHPYHRAIGACFAIPSYAELTISGRKVVGMAQVRDRLALLEQGSIPLELDLERLVVLMAVAEEKGRGSDGLSRAELLDLLRARAGGLREFAPASVKAEEVEEALIAGFADRFKVGLVEAPPTQEELELAEALAKGKYSDPS
ncbi:TPA: lipoate--protein ligase family protein, partial [Candidatus Bipolaricaulota bacterium]|nr:lipoate--protein ligase family protein [Candidatus Bipolaricaulota bacterium]